MERPPDEHGDDTRHPDVHGPRVRPAEHLRECLQPGAGHLQGQGGQVGYLIFLIPSVSNMSVPIRYLNNYGSAQRYLEAEGVKLLLLLFRY